MSKQKEITAALRASFDLALPIYLLIDPVVGDFLPQLSFTEGDDIEAMRKTREKAYGREIYSLRLASNIKLPPSMQPYLVAMSSTADPWLEHSVDDALARNKATWEKGMKGNGWVPNKIGGWLQTSMPAERLAGMLADWMSLKTEVRTDARYLRLSDSRALALLIHVLGREQIIGLMGRIAQWSFIDAYGRLEALQNSICGEAIEECPTLPRLNGMQWHLMQLGPLIHGAIAKARGEGILRRSPAGVRNDTSIPYSKAFAAAERYAAGNLKIAGLSCSTLEDQCTALTLTLLYPGWENLNEVTEFLSEANGNKSLSEEGIVLCDLLERLSVAKHTREKTHEH